MRSWDQKTIAYHHVCVYGRLGCGLRLKLAETLGVFGGIRNPILKSIVCSLHDFPPFPSQLNAFWAALSKLSLKRMFLFGMVGPATLACACWWMEESYKASDLKAAHRAAISYRG
ncbi:hypothetical protein TWF718_010117 [Orbilia javanica]|uniref:Uncharacterized protein n=1 Tax=Orbilia javanica TaxID=47235 RepID=A0AAN8MX24_9PEZI